MYFDSHFHMLTKHLLTGNTDSRALSKLIAPPSLSGDLIDWLSGDAFQSQSAPDQIQNSNMIGGIVAILAPEFAYVSGLEEKYWEKLGVDAKYFGPIARRETTYLKEFIKELRVYQDLKNTSYTNFTFLNRNTTAAEKKRIIGSLESLSDLSHSFLKGLENPTKTERFFAYSMEGGHNLSNVLISQHTLLSKAPQAFLKKIQDGAKVEVEGAAEFDFSTIDLFSLNICHLSYIPEQHLGVHAQGVTKTAQKVFGSPLFYPSVGKGLSELGCKVVRHALTHEKRPTLIDTKHMSVYTRLEFYRYREQLIYEQRRETGTSRVEKLPILNSHTGFTFRSLSQFLADEPYKLKEKNNNGQRQTWLESERLCVGKSDNLLNRNLYSNPWTINLFDEEIAETMASGGMIGLSLDQRILGAANIALDGTSLLGKYAEPELVSPEEGQVLFREKRLPAVTESLESTERLTPNKPQRHITLLALHIVHAVRTGYARLNWTDDTSPWDHLCIGSDYDGLINPINGYGTVKDVAKMREELLQYLPIADKICATYPDTKALRYTPTGTIDSTHLEDVIDKFMFRNGLKLFVRFLQNWP